MKVRTGRIVGLSENVMNGRVRSAAEKMPRLPVYRGYKPFQDAMAFYKIKCVYADIEAARVLNNQNEGKELLKRAKEQPLDMALRTRYSRFGVSALIFRNNDGDRVIYFVKEIRNKAIVTDILRKLERAESLGQLETELSAAWKSEKGPGVQPDFSEYQWQLVKRALYPEKFTALNDILQYNPNDMDTRFKRGEALLSINQFDEAIKDFDQILKADPKHEQARRCKALALRQLGREEEARQVLSLLDKKGE